MGHIDNYKENNIKISKFIGFESDKFHLDLNDLFKAVVFINTMEDGNYTMTINSMDIDIHSGKDCKNVVEFFSPYNPYEIHKGIYGAVVEFINYLN